MKFGVQFFPNFRPADKSAEEYFAESLDIAAEADELGYAHARSVEHYFERYGGYSPNPILFLAAAAQRTKRMRLITWVSICRSPSSRFIPPTRRGSVSATTALRG